MSLYLLKSSLLKLSNECGNPSQVLLEQKQVMESLSNIGRKTRKASECLREWGQQQPEHSQPCEDVNDLTEKHHKIMLEVSRSFHMASNSFQSPRSSLKEIKTRFEDLIPLCKEVKSLQDKLEHAKKHKKPYGHILQSLEAAGRELSERQTSFAIFQRSLVKEMILLEYETWFALALEIQKAVSHGLALWDQVQDCNVDPVRKTHDALPNTSGQTFDTSSTFLDLQKRIRDLRNQRGDTTSHMQQQRLRNSQSISDFKLPTSPIHSGPAFPLFSSGSGLSMANPTVPLSTISEEPRANQYQQHQEQQQQYMPYRQNEEYLDDAYTIYTQVRPRSRSWSEEDQNSHTRSDMESIYGMDNDTRRDSGFECKELPKEPNMSDTFLDYERAPTPLKTPPDSSSAYQAPTTPPPTPVLSPPYLKADQSFCYDIHSIEEKLQSASRAQDGDYIDSSSSVCQSDSATFVNANHMYSYMNHTVDSFPNQDTPAPLLKRRSCIVSRKGSQMSGRRNDSVSPTDLLNSYH